MSVQPRSCTDPPQWDDHYPAPARLRDEVDAMRDAFVAALFEVVPPEALAAIHAKGSSRKRWDSPLDYVPELSDVDIHLLFADDDGAARYLGSVEAAMRVQARTERLFRAAIPNPVHVPRLQVLVANVLWKQPDYIPSPSSTITVLHGRSEPHLDLPEEVVRRDDTAKLLSQEEYLAEVAFDILDMPGKHIWALLRGLNWRVSPTASRVVSLLGVPFDEAWSANRTGAIARLRSLGEHGLADSLTAYYVEGWEYFLSGYTETDRARAAVLAGIRSLQRGIEIARAREGA